MEKEIIEMLHATRPCLSVDEINRYLEEKLTEEERFDVENHLLDCELCSAAVEGYSQAGIKAPKVDTNELRNKITTAVQKSPASTSATKVVPQRRNFNWAVAAGLIFLLGIASYIFFQSQSEQSLFASYYQPYDKAFLATRSNNEQGNKSLTDGLNAYQNKEFDKSLTLLEQAREADPENGVIALYAGMAAMEATEYQRAANLLSEARINHLPSYATATWYLALNYLAQKDYPSCRNMLKQLGPNDSPYYRDAQKLLSRLNQ